MVRIRPAKDAKRLMVSTAHASEPEDDDIAVDYHTKTGRPVRRVRKSDSPFVDSAVAITDVESEADSDDLAPLVRRRKRKRSPSPALPEIYDQTEVSSPPTPTRSHESPVQITLSNVTINVPAGHTGPLLLQIDLKSTTLAPASTMPPAIETETKTQKSPSKDAVDPIRRSAGFLDLPAELRNSIYELIFVSDGKLNFANPTNFGRSAALLRTCKQVHLEARDILYSGNEFYFNRRCSRFGSYWESEWSEIGFKHIHHFLKMIGPTNLSLIRRLSFQFEDATPCLNPDSMSHEDRRFVNDDHLMAVLRLLGDGAKLETLNISFHGRRRVEMSDSRMIDLLKSIKVDELDFVSHPIGSSSVWTTESKQEESVRKVLIKTMVRKRKMYVKAC